jgi:eukaryotic-like serine/threonine-protein kinase
VADPLPPTRSIPGVTTSPSSDDDSSITAPLETPRPEHPIHGSSHPVSPSAAPAPVPEVSMQMSRGMGDTRDARDIMLARLIVERALATQEEVDRATARAAKTGFLGVRKDFRRLLVDDKVVTPNQLARLDEIIEQTRSGRTIPGFKMLGKLGKGTTATVYKARQLNLDRLVAIKVLPATALKSAKVVEQFYAEGRAAAKLNHPNVVQAFDVGQAADFHYFVMEYVEGPTVHELLAPGALDQERALDIVIAVADALRHAHERGFVHRDVKPKNIIIDPKGVPKLADLGLARAIADREAGLAEKGHALGTPYYISPEQVRGEVEIGPPADIYSLGATFYHMVTGSPPFTGIDAREVMNKHQHQKHRPATELKPALNPGLCEVIDKMLEKKPSNRYHDCELLLLDLHAWRAVFTLQRGESERGDSRF